MRERINHAVCILKNSENMIISFCIVYLAGIVLGVVFSNQSANKFILKDQVCNFYIIILNPDKSVFSILFMRLLHNLGYILLIGAAGIVIYTFPIEFFIIFYRGLILGSVGCAFYSLYGISGISIYIFIVVPQNLIVTFGLVVTGILNYKYIKGLCRKGKFDLTEIGWNCILGFVICAVGAIYEFLLLLILIRPLHFYF